MVDLKAPNSLKINCTKGDTLKAVPENLLQPITSIANRIIQHCPRGWYKLDIEAKRSVGVILVTATATTDRQEYPVDIGERTRVDIQHLLNRNTLPTGKIHLMQLSLVSSGEYTLNLE